MHWHWMMSYNETTLNNASTIDPSIFWESSGILSKATSQGALFSLYLAMYENALSEPIRILSNENTDNTDSVTDQLHALNHYRKAPLAATKEDWVKMNTLSSLMTSDLATARLYQIVNPQPFAQTNDPFRLPEDVINNCSYGTQKRLSKAYASSIEEDNTLLYDVVARSNGVDTVTQQPAMA